mgnify:FL=1
MVVLVYGALISVFGAVSFFSILGVGDAARATYGFNNPNQLSYYGLSSAVIIAATWYYGFIGRFWAIVGLLLSIFIISVSLSSAALLAAALVFIPFLMRGRGWFALFVFLPVLFAAALSVPDVVDNVSSRLSQVGNDSDDSLEGRGFDRIWVYPEYLIFGAGEGELSSRTFYVPDEHVFVGELHSTWGSLFFGYGAVGLVLTIAWVFSTIRAIGLVGSMFLLPFVAYGLAHMGFRFSFMWLAFSIVLLSASAAVHLKKRDSHLVCN